MQLGEHHGVIFDLDGTLVDSQLDFSLLCQQLGWPAATPILEHLATIADAAEYQRALNVIEQFERAGAAAAQWMPGAAELLDVLRQYRIPTAILTRNMRSATHHCLERLGIVVDIVLTREDAPAKPEPTGLLMIAEKWRKSPQDLLFIGDFHFDLSTAKAAGMPACLYLNADNGHYRSQADFVLEHFAQLTACYRQRFTGDAAALVSSD